MLKSYKGVPLVGIPTAVLPEPGRLCHYCSFYRQWQNGKCPGESFGRNVSHFNNPCYKVVLVREIDVLTARLLGKYVDFSQLPDVWQADERGA